MKKYLLFFFIISTTKLFSQPLFDTSKNNNWSFHFQLTAVSQSHAGFNAAYSGINSLGDTVETNALSVTTTFYLGRKLWKGAAFYFNPEIAGGKGISGAKGIAGFTNGETFRIGDPSPALYVARAYIQQQIPLKSTSYKDIEDDVNQLAGRAPTSYINITAGKFAMSDFFDDNKYSHDPRTQFLNWSLMSNGAWDYPANTRGYTLGIVAELIKPTWALRISSVQVPAKANGPTLDGQILKAHSETIEVEKSYSINKKPGTIRLLGFRTVSQAPSYNDAINAAAAGDSSSLPVFTGNYEWKKYGGVKYGFGLNIEQYVTNNIGFFLRASWNDGKTATWAFTEIDNSISDGLVFSGKLWKRNDDNAGVAVVINGLSKEHQDFLKAGFNGFIIGDGNLNYDNESIIELYYQIKLYNNIYLTGDYQFVANPAYNKDRGPVNVFSVRLHTAF